MDRTTFDRILTEEGIDEPGARDQLWNSRPPGDIGEEKLRESARWFSKTAEYRSFKTRKALNDAMAREYGWDR